MKFKTSPWLEEKKQHEFSPIDWGFILGLTLPLMCISFLLKWQRIELLVEKISIANLFFWYQSDVLFYCLYILAGLMALKAAKTLGSRVVVLLLLQLFGLLFSTLEISAHSFYLATGTTLNYNLLEYSIININELKEVLSAEGDGSSFSLLALAFLVSLVGPWILGFLVLRQRDQDEYRSIFSFYLSKRWSFVALSGLSCILILLIISQNRIYLANNLTLYMFGSFLEDKIFFSESHSKQWKPSIDSYIQLNQKQIKKNLVLIILESTRSDATSVYNPKLKTTPFLEKISRKSIVMRHAHSIVPRTSKSLVSIHCGIEPKASTVIVEAEPNGIPSKCLPELLNEIGYKTAYFQTATEYFEGRRKMAANFGYTDFLPGNAIPKRNFQETNYFGYEDRILLAPSLKWHKLRLKNEPKRPFMVTYLTNTSHHKYGLPDTHRFKWFHPNPFYNLYLNTVWYVDSFLKDLIQQYKDLGIYKNTLFVFIGDHGEGFREHNIYGHSNIVYREGLKIPFIIHDPSHFLRKLEVKHPVFQPDLLPTVLNFLNLKLEDGAYRGYNILEGPSERKLHASCWNEKTCLSSFNLKFKYIHFFGNRPDEFYDIQLDPLEQSNIISTRKKSELEIWKNQLLEWERKNRNFYNSYRGREITEKNHPPNPG